MRECLTGARNVNCPRMSMSNIIELNGLEVHPLCSTEASYNSHCACTQMAQGHLTESSAEANSNMKIDVFNEILRGICEKCRINEKVTVYNAESKRQALNTSL